VTGTAPTAQHWEALSTQLASVFSVLDATEKAAIAGLADGDPDAFAQHCAALADAMAALARHAAAPSPEDRMPDSVRAQLRQVQVRLDSLHEQTARLSASTQRALALLFPTDPLKTYGRLGGRGSSAGSLGGKGYLKA